VGKAETRWAALARRLVEHEAGGRMEATALAEATERACVRLQDRLVPLVGPDGFRIMLTNAIDITRSEHSFLQAIDARAELDGCFVNLAEAVKGRLPEEALAAVTRLLAEFIGLLGSFVGDALTLRLVRGAWPEIAWEKTGPTRADGRES
jgi:hypothetical protein